jgi:AAA domain (dynein-related subfamily)
MTDTNTQIAISDFNLEKLTTKQLERHIRTSVECGSNIAIFGRRGSGKTMIAKQIVKQLDLTEVYMNLSVYERTDLAGYPDLLSPKEKRDRFVDYILPRIFEPMITGNQPIIALLDEVDKADPSLWAPLLEFTQFKSINGRSLPNLQSVIMTGNLIAEGGARPSLPLLDRAEKYLLEATPDAWLDWAASTNEIHASIRQYIVDHPNELFGPIDAQDNYADPSPRGWHNASKAISIGEEKNWSVDVLNEKVAGFVGKKAGLDYKIYYTNYKVLLPLVHAIYSGGDYYNDWNGLTPTEKLYTTIIVCSRFASQLDAAKNGQLPPATRNVGRFIQHAGDENVLMGVRNSIQLSRVLQWNLDQIPEWNGVLPKINSFMHDNPERKSA